MSLVHDIQATLPYLQAEAEGRMVDACTITRPGDGPTFDAGVYTPSAGSSVYAGKCEVQISDGLNARETEAGGTEITVSRVMVKIPIAVEGVLEGDTVTITAAGHDPDLVDQEFKVIAGFAKTYATCRRLQVERVTV